MVNPHPETTVQSDASGAPLASRERDLTRLCREYGTPEIRSIELQGDEYLFATRLYRSMDRRGEVVLAIEYPTGSVLLHTKGWYEPDVYRLPTGGIGRDETVTHTLHRELEEETGLVALDVRLLGVLDCNIHYRGETIPFTSYVFHIPSSVGELRLSQEEDITVLRSIPIGELPAIADDLRLVPPPRRGWGQWRAIAHDFVHETLVQLDDSSDNTVDSPKASGNCE